LSLDKMKENNDYKIPKKNLKLIKKYYTQYIINKIFKNFSEEEKTIYEHILEEDEENDKIFQQFKGLLKHKNIKQLRLNIKNIIKQAKEKIQNEEEGEHESGKNSIKEEKDEDGDEEEEEEEDDDDEDDEGNEKEDDEDGEEGEENDEEKSSETRTKNHKSIKENSSNEGQLILKDKKEKNPTLDMMNRNYSKRNDMMDKSNSNKEEKKSSTDNNNLGIDPALLKHKKPNKNDDERKDSRVAYNTEHQLNFSHSQAKENSVSSTNPNKKLNQFISQIEHMKKIDNIKPTIIQAINSNNKYIMNLFQKFQKNKFNLNPKALNDVYTQIKNNPDTSSKEYIFKSIIDEIIASMKLRKNF